MPDTILRTYATPVYGFLSYIETLKGEGELGTDLKILDCGAGGPLPPLVLFSEQGFDAYGIDISDHQLGRAREFCTENNIAVDLRRGDMREIPFDDESFDCVYEHYAMCHLSKDDTPTAIKEMHRVTRTGGLCFLGVISMDSWPKKFFGEERVPGEFWQAEDDRHSMFTDPEADQLVEDWEIIKKEKYVTYLRDSAQKLSEDEWMDLYNDASVEITAEEWRGWYSRRINMANYSHMYYLLRKR